MDFTMQNNYKHFDNEIRNSSKVFLSNVKPW